MIQLDYENFVTTDPTGAFFSHYEDKTDPGFIAAANEPPSYVDKKTGAIVWTNNRGRIYDLPLVISSNYIAWFIRTDVCESSRRMISDDELTYIGVDYGEDEDNVDDIEIDSSVDSDYDVGDEIFRLFGIATRITSRIAYHNADHDGGKDHDDTRDVMYEVAEDCRKIYDMPHNIGDRLSWAHRDGILPDEITNIGRLIWKTPSGESKHRGDDQPAILSPKSRTCRYIYCGQYHREGDFPSVIVGDKLVLEWSKQNDLHRTNGPAIIRHSAIDRRVRIKIYAFAGMWHSHNPEIRTLFL